MADKDLGTLRYKFDDDIDDIDDPDEDEDFDEDDENADEDDEDEEEVETWQVSEMTRSAKVRPLLDFRRRTA